MSPVTPLGHQNSQEDVRGPHVFNPQTRSYEPDPEFKASEYPKHLYRLGVKKSEPLVVSILVRTKDQEDGLKGDWFETPGEIPVVKDLLARGFAPPVPDRTMASEYAPDDDPEAREDKSAIVSAGSAKSKKKSDQA